MRLAAFNPARGLVEFCGALAAAAWEVQLAQLLVFDSDSAQTAQAIGRVVGW